MPIDYTVSARQRIVTELIDSNLQADLDANTITLVNPLSEETFLRNTNVVINVHKGTELVNCLRSFYNRQFLTDVLTPLDVQDLDTSGFTTTHDLLPEILINFDVNLQPEDILLENLASNGNVLNSNPASYGWIGSFSFTGAVEVWPPLIRTTASRLLISRSGQFIRRRFPTYP